MRKLLLRTAHRITNVLEYPILLRTIGRRLDREFLKELVFIRDKIGLLPETIFDIGAAVGRFSQAARFVFPSAHIHAFEPIPANYAVLKSLAERDRNFHPYPIALGLADGVTTFYLNEFSFSSSLLRMKQRHKELFPFTEKERILPVDCKRLDSFPELFVARPIFMKIDVQGAEVQVLKGAGELLRQCDAVRLEVSFEEFYEDQATYREVIALMDNAGFSSFLQICPHFAGMPARPIDCDLLFLR
jgi:FkbM family methyltransferase